MYLLDSDVVIKIVKYGLKDELLGALRCTSSDLYVLPQLKYQLRLNFPEQAEKKLGSRNAYLAVSELLKFAKEAEISPNTTTMFLLANRVDIDIGEQVLFAALIDYAESKLITGDKRALRAFSRVELNQHSGVWLRIFCFEEVVSLMLSGGWFNSVRRAIQANPSVDISMNIIFGKDNEKSYDEILAGLKSYMDSLAVDTSFKLQCPKVIPK